MSGCSELAWHELLTEFNRLTTPVIRIRKAALADAVKCAGGMPDALLASAPRSDSETVAVNRAELFKFITSHGAERCDAK